MKNCTITFYFENTNIEIDFTEIQKDAFMQSINQNTNIKYITLHSMNSSKQTIINLSNVLYFTIEEKSE